MALALTSTPLVTQTWELGRSWAGFTGNGDFIHEITLLQNKGNDDLRGFHGDFMGYLRGFTRQSSNVATENPSLNLKNLGV